MPEFYHDLITEKSFEILQGLRRQFQFILIGGWAIYLYAKALKSKDIDIIIDYDQLEKIKKIHNISKNDRLKKYEMKIKEVDIDIYLPHYSELGLPVEEIQQFTRNLESFLVPIPEVLLILKIYVHLERKGTNKGRKDLIDIFSLLMEEKIDWPKYKELIEKYNLRNLNGEFKNLISSQKPIPELKLLNHRLAKLKKEILSNL